MLAFALAGGILMLLGAYHRFVLPRPVLDRAGIAGSRRELTASFALTFVGFFRKPKILTLLAFLLLYRFGEAQLSSVAKFFLLDTRVAGGLALSDDQYGGLYGIIGIAA